MRRHRRAAGLGLAVATGLVLWGPAAGAHVLIDSVAPNEDGSARLTVLFDHSCDGADTTRLVMEAPEGVTLVGAVAPDDWEFEIADGAVAWEGPALETALDGTFAVDALLTGSPGTEFVFPVEQECADGDGYTWDDVDPEQPAPRVVATADVLQSAASPTLDTGGAVTWQVFAVLGAIAAAGGLAAFRWLPR